MAIRTSDSLEDLLNEIEARPGAPQPEMLNRISAAIAKMFRLQADEVAVLEIVPPGKLLSFVLPEKLRAAGTIPLNSNSALAARTARLRRADIVNNFPSFRHATVFEGFPLGRRQDESIQKMLSAPILRDNRVVGVVQLCRKGMSAMDAGPDFSAADLAQLENIGELLARFLSLSRPA